MEKKSKTPKATAQKFKAGDLVRLNSGGPVMTVRDDIDGYNTTHTCNWVGVGGEIMAHDFPPACLTRAERSSDQK